MIFASDLDRTLIYSENSMGEADPASIVPVELYEGRNISFMTKRSIKLLKQVCERGLFIPVTTRTVAQYNRIFGFQGSMSPVYAVTCNGGCILYKGNPIQEWTEAVKRRMRIQSAPVEAIIEQFNRFSSTEWVLRKTFTDELFFSIVVERSKVPISELEEYRAFLEENGWSLSIQGRKIYLVPHSVNKGAALRYLTELTGIHRTFAAGDSLLDESLLMSASVAYAPRHGELYCNYKQHSHITFTVSSGILASEEILSHAIEFIEEPSKHEELPSG